MTPGFTRLRAASLFSLSVERNARDAQMTTHVTKDARRGAATLVCRVSRRQRARAVASLNLKKRETALSLTFHRIIKIAIFFLG